MRKLQYLSPTSLRLWYENRERFYMEYLCESRAKREPQTPPMAVGSAFDAYVKSDLHKQLINDGNKAFEFDTIFNAQVEEHNREEAKVAGKIVYDKYHEHGALLDVLTDLRKGVGKPRFEATVEGFVECVSVKIGAVPLLGKPDIYFYTENGARIIFDWKVTGYYATRNYSPKKGYVNCLPKDPKKPKGKQPHKDAFVMEHDGFPINVAHPLNEVDPAWAAQLSMYAWLLGEPVGSKFIVAIDEIVCGKDWMGNREIRIAQHRSLVTPEFQYDLFAKAHDAWYAIQAGHIFDEVSLEESEARCRMLDQRMAMENGPQTEEDLLFKSLLK